MRVKRVAECHPDKPHKSLGLCGTCYAREHSRKQYEDPAFRERKRQMVSEYYGKKKGLTQ